MNITPVFDRCKSVLTIALYSLLGLMRPETEKLSYQTDAHPLISSNGNCYYLESTTPPGRCCLTALMDQLSPTLTAVLPPLVVFGIVMGTVRYGVALIPLDNPIMPIAVLTLMFLFAAILINIAFGWVPGKNAPLKKPY